VLVVDDEETVQTVTQAMLEFAGYCVLSARDGEQAIEMIKHEAASADLVLLDMIMPRKDGLETLGELRSIRPDLRVLMTSGYNEGSAAGRLEGVHGFLQKPFGLESLLSAVAAAMGRSG
jgi:two-component system cell cycle sensor histidine kinase/response regulator CckA